MRRSRANRLRRVRREGPAAALRPARLWRTGVVLAWAATLGGAAYGLHRLELAQRQRAARRPPGLEWVGLPSWLQDPNQRQLLEEIAAQAGLGADDELFDPRLCARVGRNLAQAPWIAAVRRVWKRPDGLLCVQATFRKPLTMVERDGMAYLVDEAGVRLPRQQRAAHLNPRDWLVVRGVRGRVPAVGQAWRGQDLAAGLKLVAFLYRAQAAGRLAFRAALRGVDLGAYDPRTGGGLRVVTTEPRGYICWGLPPGQEYDIEPTAAAKLDALNRLYARLGSLPGQRPIDVRDQDYIRLLSPP